MKNFKKKYKETNDKKRINYDQFSEIKKKISTNIVSLMVSITGEILILAI